MPDLTPIRDFLMPPAGVHSAQRLPRQTSSVLVALEQRTIVRTASVQAESMVQNTKLKEIDALTREAMNGHAFLSSWANTLSRGDIILADELRFFTDVARIGKGEILADTIDTYCRESRGS